VAASFIGNKSVEGKSRSHSDVEREQNNELLPGRRTGKLSLDSEVKRTGKSSVRLVARRWLVCPGFGKLSHAPMD
jgi:hypothetical protein